MTQAEADKCVSRGAGLLDATWPEWAGQIDRETLDISSTSCVLFQLAKAYGLKGYHAMAESLGSNDALLGYPCGFFIPPGEPFDDNQSWGLLSAAWIAAITDRLLPAVEWTHREPAEVQA